MVEHEPDTGRLPQRLVHDYPQFPWWCGRLAAPFVEMCREMLEMRYLWDVPAELDDTKLCALIGPESRTPLHEAVARSYEWSAGNTLQPAA